MLRDAVLTSDLKGTLTKVLQTLRIYGPMPRVELARIAGLSRPTVSVAVQELIGQGLLVEHDDDLPGGPSWLWGAFGASVYALDRTLTFDLPMDGQTNADVNKGQ